MTREMREKTFEGTPYILKIIPDLLVTPKMVEDLDNDCELITFRTDYK